MRHQFLDINGFIQQPRAPMTASDAFDVWLRQRLAPALATVSEAPPREMATIAERLRQILSRRWAPA